MKISIEGVRFIKSFESLKLKAYQDIAGVWTIGYGSTGPHVQPGLVITESQAEALLYKDLERFDTYVNTFFRKKQMQHEHDACVSFLFNVGIGAFNSAKNPSTSKRAGIMRDGILRMEFQKHPKRLVIIKPLAEAFLWWDKANVKGKMTKVRGLTRRRIEEAELLLYNDYGLKDDGVVNAPSEYLFSNSGE